MAQRRGRTGWLARRRPNASDDRRPSAAIVTRAASARGRSREPDWTPVFLPRARLRWLKGTVRGPLEQRLQYMLRPVFEQVGAEWESPPISLQSPAGLLGGLALLWALYEGAVAIVRAAGVG